jgi:hypothetical protein
MNQKTIIAILALTVFILSASGAPPPLLTKSQANQLLTLMGFKDVEVAAVVAGSSEAFVPSESAATVIAIGRRPEDGQVTKLVTTFQYDADIGWFKYQFNGGEMERRPITMIRLVSLSGIKTISPKQAEESKH